MKLLVVFGPPAVGKMTVGTLLEQQTDFKLFHNHQVMDGIMHIFGHNSPAEEALSRSIRESVITAAAEQGINLIFTYVWNFSRDKGKHNIEAYKHAYESRGGSVYFVELSAPAQVRAQRADSPDRFTNKPNTATSEDILSEVTTTKFDSPEPFYFAEHFLRIDTTNLSAEAVVSQIREWLGKTT